MGFFTKRKDLVDLRTNVSDGIPTEGYLKRTSSPKSSVPSGIITTSRDPTPEDIAKTIAASSDNNTPIETQTQSSGGFGGGFFNFFGGSSSPSTNTTSAPSVDSTNNLEKIEGKVNDILYRLSRLTDRVELLEKKMDRAERKGGVDYAGY